MHVHCLQLTSTPPTLRVLVDSKHYSRRGTAIHASTHAAARGNAIYEVPVTGLAAFVMVTVDGYHAGPNEAFDFWSVDNDEFERFSVEQLDQAETIVFGRKTFEGMVAYWPTDEARAGSPRIAERMNAKPKLVVSRTVKSVDWQPTTIIDNVSRLGSLDRDALVLGSSQLVACLARLGLLDELRLMINPIAIGAGSAVLSTLTDRLPLHLRDVDRFDSGNVLLTYGLES